MTEAEGGRSESHRRSPSSHEERMPDAHPSEFLPDGKHWADVIGCDVRAKLPEIQRAAKRRADEIMAGPLRGEYLGAALERVSLALSKATAAKGRPSRSIR